MQCYDSSLTPWLVSRGCVTSGREGLLPLSAPQALVQPAAPAGSSAAFLLDAVMSLMADSQHRKLSLVRAVFFVLLPTSLPRSPSRPNRGSDKPGIGASQLIDSSPFWAERATMHGQTVQGRLNGLFQQAGKTSYVRPRSFRRSVLQEVWSHRRCCTVAAFVTGNRSFTSTQERQSLPWVQARGKLCFPEHFCLQARLPTSSMRGYANKPCHSGG